MSLTNTPARVRVRVRRVIDRRVTIATTGDCVVAAKRRMTAATRREKLRICVVAARTGQRRCRECEAPP